MRAAEISIETDYFQTFGQGYLQVRAFVLGILGKPHKSEYGIFGAVDGNFFGHGNLAGILHAFIVVRDYNSPGVLVYGRMVAISNSLINRIPEIAHRVCRQSEERPILYAIFDSADSFELTPHIVGFVRLDRILWHIECRTVVHCGVIVVAVRVIGIVIGKQWIKVGTLKSEGVFARFGRIFVFAGNGHNVIRTVTETVAKFG